MANYFILCKRMFFLLILNFVLSLNTYAQCPTIDFVDLRNVPGYAQFDNMSVCGDADTLSMIIYTGDPGTVLGFEFELDLPSGLEYAGWEFTDFLGTSISNTDSDGSNPVFVVDGFDSDSLIVVNIGLVANCEVDISDPLMLNYEFSYNFLDPNNLFFNCSDVGNFENELNSAVKIPVLNVLDGLSPAELTMSAVGPEFCQSLSISQDGISAYLDEFTFEILGLEIGTDLLINSITANGTENVPFTFDAATNATTATISGDMFLGNGLPNPADQQFNTSEVLDMEVCYELTACPSSADLPFVYNAYYGCDEEQCQISGQNSFLRIRPTGSLDPIASTNLVSPPTVCGASGEIALTVTNPNVATDQNKYTDINVGFETCEPANLGIDRVEINGIQLPPDSYFWIGDDLNVDFSILPAGFDPDGPGVGLMDLDGDGVFDDLDGGQSLNVNVFLEVLCGVSEVAPSVDICPSNDCGFAQFYVEVRTNCGNLDKSFPPGLTGFDIVNGPTMVSNDETGIPNGTVPPIAQGLSLIHI